MGQMFTGNDAAGLGICVRLPVLCGQICVFQLDPRPSHVHRAMLRRNVSLLQRVSTGLSDASILTEEAPGLIINRVSVE